MENDVFVIAEIGANHGGDSELCETMIEAAARAGADAVKLQKRHNREMFTQEAYNAPYQNENSYGKTYGEHREALDWFGLKEFKRFKGVAEDCGVLFFATPFEEVSAKFLAKVGMPLWKIASCDVRNVPFVQFVAQFGEPLIISTGGASYEDIDRLVKAIEPINPNFALLHCVSRYPNDDNLELGAIIRLKDLYPGRQIGFSSHHPGILPLIVARCLGASIFEVHFTLNRGSRGTDHGFSMEPRGLETLCHDLRRVDPMIGFGIKETLRGGFLSKMGKGVYLRKPLKSGRVLSSSDFVCKSPHSGGFEPFEVNRLVGRILARDCSTGVNIGEEVLA